MDSIRKRQKAEKAFASAEKERGTERHREREREKESHRGREKEVFVCCCCSKMAEQNPLGNGKASSPKVGSAGPPWAFLVQDAEKGTRQQLRVDGDAVQVFDKKGKPVNIESAHRIP